MKKIILLMLLILSLLLVSCNSGITPTPTTAPATAAPTEEPVSDEIAAPAGSAAADMDNLTGTIWAWIGFTDPVQQFAVENPMSYTLTFQEESRVAVVADCNNASGSYTADDSRLTIEVGPMTKAACPSDSHSDDFVKYLGYAAIYFYDGGHLFIDLMADGGTLEFSPSIMATSMADDSEMAVSLTSHTCARRS